MTVSEIIENLKKLSAAIQPEEFVYDFLTAFGTPKATISRLKSGDLNLAKKDGCTLLKAKVYFEPLLPDLLKSYTPAEAIQSAQRTRQIMGNKPRFLIATDFQNLAAFDTRKNETVTFPIAELHDHYAFFLPLAGMERTVFQAETEADVKAAEHMAKLYDLSYFRGDCQPVLLPEDEEKFTAVTYNYYEQLNGYEYLKSLGIGYHFYQGRYLTAIGDVLDTDKKTILHIPHVRAGESTKDKYGEVDAIHDIIGTVVSTDQETGVLNVERKSDGKIIKVADLVDDDPARRDRVVTYLRKIEKPEDLDLIIALGMAKEGFDWKFCEHALTVGYRGSLTEVIQIIGRCTRDSVGKVHAQFTNLIAQPDAKDTDVAISVNNMLKAITCSLLMEQVLAPVIKFKPKQDDEETPPGELRVKGLKGATTERVKKILAEDINDLKAAILSDDSVNKAITGAVDPEVLNKVLIPKVIETKYPQLTDDEREQVRQHVVVDSVVRNGEIEVQGDKKFIRMAGRFINIDDLSIDLIDSINPFQRAYEIISKTVNAPTLKAIQDCIAATRISMTDEEAILLFPKVKAFVKEKNREPMINALDPLEQRMASALIYIKKLRQQRGQ